MNAQTYQLKGDYFVRSSTDFLSENNKIGVLHEGSTFRVVNQIQERNGAEALEIEITAMTSDSYVKPSPTGKIFIYRANKAHFINRTTTEAAASATPCIGCDKSAQAERASTASNRLQIGEVAEGVVILANQAPKSKNEVVTAPPPRMVGPLQPGSLDDKIKQYSTSSQVTRMIDWAMKNKSSSSRGICYRKVKEAMATLCGPPKLGYTCRNPFAPEGGRKGPGGNLLSSVSTEMSDSFALSAKNRLKKDGFVNLLDSEPYKSEMKSPSAAPKGAILVYSSGIPCNRVSDCGHTEIKTDVAGKSGYVSDYYSADAINETPRARKYGSNYKLVGVMIKP